MNNFKALVSYIRNSLSVPTTAYETRVAVLPDSLVFTQIHEVKAVRSGTASDTTILVFVLSRLSALPVVIKVYKLKVNTGSTLSSTQKVIKYSFGAFVFKLHIEINGQRKRNRRVKKQKRKLRNEQNQIADNIKL